jgi:signal transduction histidine kinase
MADPLRQLPTVLVLGALVGIFLSLQRRHLSPRVRYWLIGWLLMFLHFSVSLFKFGSAPHLGAFLELATLQLAAVAFLVSVSGFLERATLVCSLGVGFAVVVSVYSALMAWNFRFPWPYVVCGAMFFLVGAVWGSIRHRLQGRTWVVPVAVVLFGTWILPRVLGGHFATGYLSLLVVLYGITAILLARRYPRFSPGVISTCGGFALWAGVRGIQIFAPGVVERSGAQDGIWNVPQFIVAVGMILILLEEESHAAQMARSQLQHFAEVTSHLLSGVDVKSYCDHIAKVIAEATTFDRVVILLADEDQHLTLAGQAGLTETDQVRVREGLGKFTIALAEDVSRRGRPIGKTAVIVDGGDLEPCASVRSTRQYAPNPYWRTGDELKVPLRTPSGNFLGLICLDDPREPEHVTREEMAKIEMLAGDLAMAADNAALHRQLVLTEKLASVGQLIRGVAHEMNNPLTSVLGYAELMGDRATDPELRRGLGVIFREGQRMRGILGNLLRFAQQDHFERRALDLLPLLHEILREKVFETQSRGIELVDKLASSLPLVSADGGQMRQVFLNILNNALDAVETAAEKRVTIMARAEENRVVLSFIDTGPGFSDPTRIFDPFFTTKPPGKGVGLGLSICYGVLKQHGGDISARNVHPCGACITIELPAAKEARLGA